WGLGSAVERLGLTDEMTVVAARRTSAGPGPPVPHCSAAQAAADSASAGRRWRPCGGTDVFSGDAPPRCLPEPLVPAPSSAPVGRCWVVSVRASDMWEVTPL
ncbi:hypothetical protein ABZ668_26190, partial [Streptomyces parvus]